MTISHSANHAIRRTQTRRMRAATAGPGEPTRTRGIEEMSGRLSFSLSLFLSISVVHRSPPCHIMGRGQRGRGERALDDRTSDRSCYQSTRTRSRHWERGRQNSGQFSLATALTRREPRTCFLATDLRDLGRSSFSRPFVTPTTNQCKIHEQHELGVGYYASEQPEPV